jgi:hypothetical protein
MGVTNIISNRTFYVTELSILKLAEVIRSQKRDFKEKYLMQT